MTTDRQKSYESLPLEPELQLDFEGCKQIVTEMELIKKKNENKMSQSIRVRPKMKRSTYTCLLANSGT